MSEALCQCGHGEDCPKHREGDRWSRPNDCICPTPPPTREPDRLTEEERAQLRTHLSWCYEPTDRGIRIEADAQTLEAWIESILAARLAGGPTLADAWDEQLRRVEGWHHAGLWHASCPGVPTNIHLTRPRQLEAKCRLCGFALVAMDGNGEAIHVPPRTPESETTDGD